MEFEYTQNPRIGWYSLAEADSDESMPGQLGFNQNNRSKDGAEIDSRNALAAFEITGQSITGTTINGYGWIAQVKSFMVTRSKSGRGLGQHGDRDRKEARENLQLRTGVKVY